MGGRARIGLFVAALAAVAVANVSCGSGREQAQHVPVRLPEVTDASRSAAVHLVAPEDLVPGAVGSGAAADASARRLDAPAPAVTFAFTGDNLTHSPIVVAAWNGRGYDFTPMFAEIAPMISWADVGICHLETPVAPPGEAISTYPQYGVPADIAPSLAAVGYDRCSTASNHTMDRGVAGIDATVAALAAAGIAQSGMARSAEEAVPPLFTVHGMTFAHLSFTYGFNGASLPAGQPWRSNLLSADAVIAQAREARARGAQVVIASLHWGNEGSNVITAEQRSIAEQVTASGQVDVIVGHHVHVIQPIEQVNGRWVVYGMGNILSNLPTAAGRVWPASTQDGMIVTLSFTRQPDGSVDVSRPMVVPTWVDKNARWLIRAVQQDLVDQDVPLATRQQLAVSLARTTAVVGDFLAPSP